MGHCELAASLCVEGTAALIWTWHCVCAVHASLGLCVFVNVPPSVRSLCVYVCECVCAPPPRSGNSRSCWPHSDSLLLSNIVSPWWFQLLLHWDPPSLAAGLSKTFPHSAANLVSYTRLPLLYLFVWFFLSWIIIWGQSDLTIRGGGRGDLYSMFVCMMAATAASKRKLCQDVHKELQFIASASIIWQKLLLNCDMCKRCLSDSLLFFTSSVALLVSHLSVA